VRLETLEIDNYRRFRTVRVEFPDGIIGLVGRNGAGKSTFIEAIGWALFGHEAARTGRDLLKRRGAPPGEDVRVRLTFRFGGHAYEVTRELKGKNLSHVASLVVDGKPLVAPGAKSEGAVTEYLSRVFHMDRDAFFTSLVARQKELNALSDMRPGERKAVILRMLRIDAVDAAIQRARETKRDLRREAETLSATLIPETELAAREERLRAERERLQKKAEQEEEAVARSTARVEEARTLRAEQVAKAERYREVQERLARLRERDVQVRANLDRKRNELKEIDARVEERTKLEPQALSFPALKERLELLTAVRERATALARQRAEVKRAEDGVAALEKKLQEAEARREARAPSRTALKRVDEWRDRLQAQLLDLERQAAEVAAGRREQAREMERLATRMREVERLGIDTPCPTCTRPLGGNLETVIGHLRRERDGCAARDGDLALADTRLKAEIGKAKGELQALTDRHRELSQKVEELVRAETEKADLVNRLQSERDRLTRLQDALFDLEGPTVEEAEYQALRDQTAAAQRARDRYLALEGHLARRKDVEETLQLLTAEVARAREDLTKGEQEAAAIAFDRKTHDLALRAFDEAQAALAQARVGLERARGEVKRLDDEAARLAADRARQAEVAGKVATLRAEAHLLDHLAGDRDGGLLVAFKHALIGRVRPVLSERAGALFRELTDGRYARMELSDDYDLLIHDEGEAFHLTRFSGGEGDLANLCLRLAIGQVLAERAGGTEFHFLALDEVFGSQDEVRKGNILRALSGLASQFRQILVVTHVEDVRESVDHVLRVVERPDGTSDIVPG